MNPDIFEQVPVPDSVAPFIRRLLIADQDQPVDFEFTVRATGYCYLGWTPRGRWQGWVNGVSEYDTQVDGPFHLSGQILNSLVVCRVSGPLRQIFAEMSATGQYELFGIPAKETVERAIPAPAPSNSGWSKDMGEPEDLLSSFCDAIAVLSAQTHRVPNHVKIAVDMIERSDGNTSIAETAFASGVSERHLRRDFSKIVGLSPKAFCRTLQVNAALNSLLAIGDKKLAHLANKYGFADQAHMTRCFVEFIGNSPKASAEGIEPTLAKFVGQSRNLL